MDTNRTPGLLVARRVLWKIAMLCTVVGLVAVAGSVVADAVTDRGNPVKFIGFIGAGLVWIAVALWIAYSVVRMVGRERLGEASE